MILADKILMLRKKNGWSQEELAEKLNVSRQAISKWEGALAIPDINKIIDMAELFGVTTDYLLKDNITETLYSDESDEKVRKVTLNEVNNYLADNKQFSVRIAIGTLLCILSPMFLILLSGISEFTTIISENLAVAIGLIYLFVSICLAIAIFIISDSKMKKYEYLYKEKFDLEYGVNSIIKEKKEKYMNKYNTTIALCVVSIIIGVLPLIITGIFNINELVILSMVDVLLLVVGISVFFLIIVSMRKEAFDKILNEDDFSEAYKNENKKVSKFSGFFWPIVTAIYLCWSFITDDWDLTWIVWPIAGLIYAGIAALLHNEDKQK